MINKYLTNLCTKYMRNKVVFYLANSQHAARNRKVACSMPY